MYAEYLSLFLAILFALFLAGTFWSLSHFLGPKNRTPEKMIPYECGSDTMGTRDVRFSVKFYPVVVLFLLFDVGVVFLYIWAVIAKAGGWKVLLTVLPLFVIMMTVLFYAVRKGAFQWRA